MHELIQPIALAQHERERVTVKDVESIYVIIQKRKITISEPLKTSSLIEIRSILLLANTLKECRKVDIIFTQLLTGPPNVAKDVLHSAV